METAARRPASSIEVSDSDAEGVEGAERRSSFRSAITAQPTPFGDKPPPESGRRATPSIDTLLLTIARGYGIFAASQPTEAHPTKRTFRK